MEISAKKKIINKQKIRFINPKNKIFTFCCLWFRTQPFYNLSICCFTTLGAGTHTCNTATKHQLMFIIVSKFSYGSESTTQHPSRLFENGLPTVTPTRKSFSMHNLTGFESNSFSFAFRNVKKKNCLAQVHGAESDDNQCVNPHSAGIGGGGGSLGIWSIQIRFVFFFFFFFSSCWLGIMRSAHRWNAA